MKKLLLAILFLTGLLPASAYTSIENGLRIFLTRDPAGFVDGPNLYTYVKQNPWTNFDPEGLWTQDQYKQDIAQNQAKIAAINKNEHPTSSDLKMRGQYESKISQDNAGIQHIDDLVGTFNSYSKLAGGPQIGESAKKTIDDTTGRVRGEQVTLGQQQYSQLSNFSFGAFASEQAVTTAAGGVVAKGVGMAAAPAIKAATPYLTQLFSKAAGLFGKPATESVVSQGTTVYRVWGDGAGASGRSWTTVDPSTVANFRDAAGLPAQNSGRFVSTGTLKSTEGVTTRGALPLGGNAGGLPEVVVPNPTTQIQLQSVQGINPEY